MNVMRMLHIVSFHLISSMFCMCVCVDITIFTCFMRNEEDMFFSSFFMAQSGVFLLFLANVFSFLDFWHFYVQCILSISGRKKNILCATVSFVSMSTHGELFFLLYLFLHHIHATPIRKIYSSSLVSKGIQRGRKERFAAETRHHNVFIL